MIVFALSNNRIDFAPATEIDEIIQNVRTILTTYTFSVPLDRRFGINADFIDSPLNDEGIAKMQDDIFNAIREYEPRVIVKEVSITTDPTTGKANPFVDIDFKGGY